MAETTTSGPFALRDRPDLGKLQLRVDDEAAALAGGALGLQLPKAINRAWGGATLRAIRLGPDEIVLLMPRAAVATTLATLEQTLADRHRALVDLSARLVTVELAGPAARDTLAAACPLDLHPLAFGPDQVSRSVLGKIEVILDCRSTDRFCLLANRSYAPYLQRLLAEAGREHGLAVAIPH